MTRALASRDPCVVGGRAAGTGRGSQERRPSSSRLLARFSRCRSARPRTCVTIKPALDASVAATAAGVVRSARGRAVAVRCDHPEDRLVKLSERVATSPATQLRELNGSVREAQGRTRLGGSMRSGLGSRRGQPTQPRCRAARASTRACRAKRAYNPRWRRGSNLVRPQSAHAPRVYPQPERRSKLFTSHRELHGRRKK